MAEDINYREALRRIIDASDRRKEQLRGMFQRRLEKLAKKDDPEGRIGKVVRSEMLFLMEAYELLPKKGPPLRPLDYLLGCDLGVWNWNDAGNNEGGYYSLSEAVEAMEESARRVLHGNRGPIVPFPSPNGRVNYYPHTRLKAAVALERRGVLPKDFLIDFQRMERFLANHKLLKPYKEGRWEEFNFDLGHVLAQLEEAARENPEKIFENLGEAIFWRSPWDKFSDWEEFFREYGLNPELEGWETEEKPDPNLKKNLENLSARNDLDVGVILYLGLGSGRNIPMIRELYPKSKLVGLDYSQTVLGNAIELEKEFGMTVMKSDLTQFGGLTHDLDYFGLPPFNNANGDIVIIDWLTSTNLPKPITLAIVAETAMWRRKMPEKKLVWIGSYYHSNHPWLTLGEVRPELKGTARQWATPDNLYLSAYTPEELKSLFLATGFKDVEVTPYTEEEQGLTHNYLSVVATY